MHSSNLTTTPTLTDRLKALHILRQQVEVIDLARGGLDDAQVVSWFDGIAQRRILLIDPGAENDGEAVSR